MERDVIGSRPLNMQMHRNGRQTVVARPQPESRQQAQRGQYFNLHLHLKLFKGWQPPSYPFTSHLPPFFSFLFFSFAASYHWNDIYHFIQQHFTTFFTSKCF